MASSLIYKQVLTHFRLLTKSDIALLFLKSESKSYAYYHPSGLKGPFILFVKGPLECWSRLDTGFDTCQSLVQAQF